MTTARGGFTGDLTAAYRGKITITYDPPMFGLRQTTTLQHARWVGAGGAQPRRRVTIVPGGGQSAVSPMRPDPHATVSRSVFAPPVENL